MFNQKYLKRALLMILGIMTVLIIHYFISKPVAHNKSTSAYLIKPFSNDMLLITSAGQSTDAYIFQDLTNELRINNLFMPEATSEDIDEISAVIIVVGYSEVGFKLHDKTFESEYSRVNQLIVDSKAADLPVIAVYLGGKFRRNSKTDKLLDLTCSESDYIICSSTGNQDDFIGEIAKRHDIPIAFIDELKDLSKPLVSVFR